MAEGEIDYTVADSHLFELLRHFYPDLRVAFPLGPTDRIAWALPKDDEPLRESIAAYFAEIEATGELKQIFDRYYFASSEFDYVGSRAFVRHVNTRLPRYRDFFLDRRAVDRHRLALARRNLLSRVALGPRSRVADRRARHDDADRAHGEHDGGQRSRGCARQHPRRRTLLPARAPQGARAHRRARPLLARRRRVQLGVRASRGRSHPHADARRRSRPLGRSSRRACRC